MPAAVNAPIKTENNVGHCSAPVFRPSLVGGWSSLCTESRCCIARSTWSRGTPKRVWLAAA